MPSILTSFLPNRPRKKLEVGDIVLLRDDEQVPADILVLSTADEDGLCCTSESFALDAPSSR